MKTNSHTFKLKKKDVVLGASFSILIIIFNVFFSLFITPLLLNSFGTSEYGVYKTIASFSSALMIIDLGLGSTIIRYVSKFLVNDDENSFIAFKQIMFFQAIVLMVVAGIVVTIIYALLPIIYSGSLTFKEIDVAKRLFIILGISVVVHIFENFLNGYICGYNKFSFANGVKLFRILIRFSFYVLVCLFFKKIELLVVCDLILIIFVVIVELLYLYVCLKAKIIVKIDFSIFKTGLFYETLAYTGLMFASSIASQVNANLDNVLIGATLGSLSVSIYSSSLLIFSMFEQISSSISSVMLPTITESLKKDGELAYKTTINIVVECGRAQFILLGGILGGFIIFGIPFLNLWLGDTLQYSQIIDIYLTSIIMMVPAVFELVINVLLSILRAKNKLLFRTIVLLATTLLNLCISFVGLIVFESYYLCAIGTGLSFLIGPVIIMGVYYRKVFKINVLQIYKKVFAGVLFSIIFTTFLTFCLTRYFNLSWPLLILCIIIFLALYCVSLMFIGFNANEKNKIIYFINKIRRKWRQKL